MANERDHRDRLHWTGGYCRGPVWPREPNVDVIKLLAKRHLIAELPAAFDGELLEVSFFAEGGFNKLYQISCAGHHTSYLFRVAIPIVPYYKTESEVATIAFVHANTSIPVPRVFAWDSNRGNELTFEWILMEKMDGVPLWDVWRKVPWERKLELTETIAGMIKQLRDRKFDRIGGLFFKSALNRGNIELRKAPEPKVLLTNSIVDEGLDAGIDNPDAKTSKMALRPAIQDSNADNRSRPETGSHPTGLHSINGEAQSELKQLARITRKIEFLAADPQSINNDSLDEFKQVLLGDEAGSGDPPEARPATTTAIAPLEGSEVTRPVAIVNQADFAIGQGFDSLFFDGNRLYLPGNRGPYKSSLEWLSAEVQVQLRWIKDGPIEDDDDYTSDFEEEASQMEALCYGYLKCLPTIFGDDEKDSFTLHHHDLNLANILVYPETFDIIGIVDWEMIDVAPEWRASEHPRFLEYMEPFEDEEEPPIPSYEDEDDIAVLTRDRWDYRILRHHFDGAMDEMTRNDGVIVDSLKTKAQRDCHRYLRECTNTWCWAEDWLKSYRTTGVSKNHEDRVKETLEDSETEAQASIEATMAGGIHHT